MPDPVDANQLMATLRAQLTTLNKTLDLCAIDSRVFDIETYINGEVPDVISPQPCYGKKALTKAKTALRGLSRMNDQHPGTVIRTPGVVLVDKDLQAIVEDINDLKDALKAFIIAKYPEARARRHFIQTEFSGRVMLQVYRHIYFNTRPVEKIRFTWSPYTESTYKLTQKKALELLKKRNESGVDHKIGNRFKALRMAIDYVSQTDAEYVIKKQRSPFPKANIYYGSKDYIEVPASIPLIIYSNTGSVDISDMPEYDKSKRRTRRSDKQDVDLIFKPLYLYQKITTPNPTQ